MSNEMFLKSAVLSLTLGVGLFTQAAHAAENRDEPNYWLRRMVHASHTLNYEGTFVYVHNSHVQTMRVIHGVTPEGERERLVSLSGPSREVIRDDQAVTCILPHDRSIMLDKTGNSRPLAVLEPEELDRLKGQYDISLKEQGRVAGRAARKISIMPRDHYRYGHNLWVDEDTGLLVGTELLDEHGNTLEQLMFTSLVRKDSIPEEMLRPGTAAGTAPRQERPATAEQQAAETGWYVSKLPPGFRKGMQSRHPMPTSDVPVDHQVYTDGMSAVSVFIERDNGKDKPLTGSRRLGAVNFFAKVFDGYRVTVVGEVPAVTVREIGENVRYKAGSETND